MNKYLIKNSEGKRSVTMTAFVIGFLVSNAKLLLSELVIGSYTMSTFTGVDYAAALTALGGIYVLRRANDSKKTEGISNAE